MLPKCKSEFTRETRKRVRDNILRRSEEFFQFIRDTPFASRTTDSEKFEVFLRLHASNAQSPANTSARCTAFHEVVKSQKREPNKPQVPNARKKAKVEIVIPNAEPPRSDVVDEHLAADDEFDRRFNQNRFGVSYPVCDRL